MKIIRHALSRFAMTRTEWTQIGKWLACYVVCSLLPIWGSVVLLKVFTDSSLGFQDFTNNGEFALYTASLLGSLFYLLFRDSLAPRFPHTAVFGIAGLVGIVVATVVFSGALLANKAAASDGAETTILKLNPGALALTSVIVYAGVLVLFLIATVTDIRLTAYQPRGVQAEEMDELRDTLRKRREDDK